ncbi:preprotein translocase subunit SecG [Spiroplasma clarkii]|uniref:Protein-export membrane protein SecG n=1 Tax=Spiroplasma clarkii TaxID=2139 RepID=A0A1Y0L2P0_9MOLU|nr:preprotein translocase subunit SecG [Spiroplasma clarkii]ARU92294.1 preprotein translocase subunit SecG [Spiroplasma clarkii]ATX71604.1 preprotein translocase subunit SecG [Spiroplasma clarkii]
MFNFLASTAEIKSANYIIFAFEIVALVVSLLMITVGMIQNKTSQTGLSALNGGNDELFSNSKERGSDKTLSMWMLGLGIAMFIITIVIGIITNVVISAS